MGKAYSYFDEKHHVPADVQAALQRIDLLANWMDARWTVPGTGFRIGIDPLIGLIPGIGDSLATAIGAYILFEAHRLGAPNRLKLRMAANLGVDWLLGSVPLAGDLFDAAYKANLRNANLLRRYLQETSQL